jgi:hypothetical protein
MVSMVTTVGVTRLATSEKAELTASKAAIGLPILRPPAVGFSAVSVGRANGKQRSEVIRLRFKKLCLGFEREG